MKIKEVSEQYDITPDTLRYYERIGLIRNVPRDKNGIRNYLEENCNTIAFIKCMRSGNVSIEGLTEYIELYNQGSRETYEARKAILVRERDRLKERMSAMQEALAYLNRKIATYDRWSK
jgi:DNA-binding transcriptional MerR regulator